MYPPQRDLPTHGITRVLIVDDSALAGQLLATIIGQDAGMTVVGMAKNGREGVELAGRAKPDVILMDLNMPEMDGFEATKQIMAYHPTPILVVTSSVYRGGVNQTFKALALGALDVFDKRRIQADDGAEAGRATAELLERVRTLARVKVVTHPLGKLEGPRGAVKMPASRLAPHEHLVAIAASTGGPHALMVILRALPKDLGCGVVVVQHITANFAEGLAEWLDRQSPLNVTLATQGARVEPGTVYIAPTGLQLRVGSGGALRLTEDASPNGHQPSANVLFESVAQAYGAGSVGIVLTGMGDDGASGALAIKEADGLVLAQDEATSVIFGMPKAVIDRGIADQVLPLDRIPEAILSAVQPPAVRHRWEAP